MKIIETRDTHDVLEFTVKKEAVIRKSLSKESSFIVLFKSAFLPIGYPSTVSKDYINYQFYDTLQAFCSSLIGMLATRSMLQGLGVGDSKSSVLSALLTWTLRDGVSMISRIVFAYIYANKFSSELKSWRYAADFLNNIGYALDFTAASFAHKKFFTILASFSVVFKTMTAVAGGATKTALTNHFAINGNTADLDAKDGSQETLVNLVGMIVGSYFIQLVPLENLWIWTISSVILKTVNRQRARILLDNFIRNGSILCPDNVALKESLIFHKDYIYMGASIQGLNSKDLAFVIKSFQDTDTVMIKDKNVRLIFIQRGSSAQSILKSYLTAVLDQRHEMKWMGIQSWGFGSNRTRISPTLTPSPNKTLPIRLKMSSRFGTVSKYRNCVFNVPKKQAWKSLAKSSTNEPPVSACPTSFAYATSNGIQIQSLQDDNSTILSLSSGSVRDMDYSTFVTSTSYLLAAGTEDSIKIYANDSLLSHHAVGNGVYNIAFNNFASNILIASSDSSLLVYNVETQSVYKSFDALSGIQSLDWTSNGSNVVSVSKDNVVRLWDVRSPNCISQGNCHSGIKPSKVVCLKNNSALTTGFSSRREREFCLWDLRDLTKPISTSKIDSSTGTLTPLYDRDTDIVFMMGKGDSVIRWAQVEDDKVQEFPSAAIGNNILGSCLIPKKACSIMSGEIDRILVISGDGSSMIPVSVVVPRKSYSDFHSDIFPDTLSDIPSTSAFQWEQNSLTAPSLISLDPKNDDSPAKEINNMPKTSNSIATVLGSQEILKNEQIPEDAIKTFSIPKSSAYRFVEGKVEVQFKDINNLNYNNSNECNGFEANTDVLAFSLNGAGGRVGLWLTKDVGRVPVKIPSVIAGSDICDFKFDPFNNYRLATATEDGKIRLWTIPITGLKQDITAASDTINAHSSRCSLLQFHHLASDVLLSASPEIGSSTIKIWNLKDNSIIQEVGHPDNILGAAFSFDGNNIGSVCRDRIVRIFDKNGVLLQSGPSHEGLKASRIVWLGDTGKIATFGFGKANARELRVYDVRNLSEPCGTLNIGTSPSLAVPYYDKDTGLISLSGRGDSYISFYEVTEAGAVQLASRFDCPPPQQSVQFLPKRFCDIAAIQIMVGYRITSTTVDKVSVKVPRLHKDYFQDDIFCPTLDIENPHLSVEEWIEGKVPTLKLIDLRPPGMPLLSQRVAVPIEKKTIIFERERTEQEKKDDAMKNMIEQASKLDSKLEQDEMEGCAEEEWDD